MEQEIDWEQELYGGGYLQLDRERDRKKRKDFWAALSGTSSGVALMVDWIWSFGSAVDVILPFLELTGEKAESFPCPAETPCGCRHSIGETSRGEVTAACCCEWDCGTYQIQPEDVLFHGISMDRFGEAIRHALGFAAPSAAAYTSTGLREIGRYAPAAVPVYLSLVSEAGLAREMARLLGLREGPFLVLTPTGRSWSPEVEAMARPHAGGHISLSSVLDASAAGFASKGTIEPMLAEFVRRVASLRDSGGTLKNIHREIASVRSEFVELRSAKQRLEKMLADGMFAFTRKVDAASFKVFCMILAEGDVAKASRSLGESEDMVRAVVRRWEGKGKEYRAMVELVRWRKKVGRKEKLPLNEAILHERAETADYPGLLSDVLDGLLSMTEENWSERCEELAEVLRPVVAEGQHRG
jgi:hypothetical protein